MPLSAGHKQDFAMMFHGNPYEMLHPPNPDGGSHSQEEDE